MTSVGPTTSNSVYFKEAFSLVKEEALRLAKHLLLEGKLKTCKFKGGEVCGFDEITKVTTVDGGTLQIWVIKDMGGVIQQIALNVISPSNKASENAMIYQFTKCKDISRMIVETLVEKKGKDYFVVHLPSNTNDPRYKQGAIYHEIQPTKVDPVTKKEPAKLKMETAPIAS